MPGRQAHGRSLVAGPTTKAKKKSQARTQKTALNAYGIAQEQFPTKLKKTPRVRELDAEFETKRDRDEEGEGDEYDEEEEGPKRKKLRGSNREAGGPDVEYGSDSEGNEWRLGGLAEDDDDSEIESDDAFGESDDEKFQGYTFRGSKSKGTKNDDSEDNSDDDQGETLGEEAIDLATALDQFEEDSDEQVIEDKGAPSESSDSSDGSEEDDDEDDEDDEDGDEEFADPDQLEALEGLISGFGGEKGEDEEPQVTSRPKIGLSDLGLAGLKDPFMRRSVKLMNKEEKEQRPGATKKLDIPLSRRQQDRIDRAAAYEKTNETLDRWTDTVKQNRRADHLQFPLPQNSATAGLDRTEIQPLRPKNANNELESTIMSIMEQSGLSLEQAERPKEQEYDEEGNELSRKEVMNRKRLQRELNSREAKRTRRIKKIKSKAYHRVHRKQRERDEMATREAMEEAGEIDSEDEREAQDRRRALERVGQRHKESKWAKIGSKVKRAVWDDNFRAGLTEMARKDEELRRRKEGKAGGSDDESDSTSDESEEGDAPLRRQLDELEAMDDEPQSGLMGMKFMQKAEAAKKKANDELIAQIRRDLDGEEVAEVDSEEDVGEVGRRQYGVPGAKTLAAGSTTGRGSRPRHDDQDVNITLSNGGGPARAEHKDIPAPLPQTAGSTVGAWSRGETRRKKKSSASARIEDLDLNANIAVASRPSRPKPSETTAHPESGADSDSDADGHLPLAIRDQALVARAFAGEDVVGEFAREKDAAVEADEDKVVDNTLPGWGSWVGEGVSGRELRRHQGRFLTKVEGVKKKDRKDAKLDKVIVNEKRVKKNDRYLASQLPHPFESRQQYERSLRLPVGPEWMTKETFQDSTKPRVLMKQGVITPISKPIT